MGFEWEIFNGLKSNNEIQKTSIEKNMVENKKMDAEEKLKLFEEKVKTSENYEIINSQMGFECHDRSQSNANEQIE